MNTLYQKDLNKYCQDFLVTNNNKVSPSRFLQETDKIYKSLFEQLLLFNTVSFNVYGENIPLCVLLNVFGLKNFEALLEQGAIKFTLWNQLITHLVDHIDGIDPLQHGTLTSGPHSDPEQSIELGFNWMKNQPMRSDKRRLIRKVRDLYEMPEKSISSDAVNLTRSIYNSGKLDVYGFMGKMVELQKLDRQGRATLGKCAEEILQYKYMLSSGMTSYDNFEFYKIFNNSNQKIHSALQLENNFTSLCKLENIPDLKAVYSELENPFDTLSSLRAKRTSKKFRQWLEECTSNDDSLEITKEYVDAIARRKGFFETKTGKFSKTISMSIVGAGVGTLIAGPVGALAGAGALRATEPLADIGLDLLDEFVLDGILKGWTPKIFFEDIHKIRQ